MTALSMRLMRSQATKQNKSISFADVAFLISVVASLCSNLDLSLVGIISNAACSGKKNACEYLCDGYLSTKANQHLNDTTHLNNKIMDKLEC
jgi:hypothetical protein